MTNNQKATSNTHAKYYKINLNRWVISNRLYDFLEGGGTRYI